jgi:hypothetical protein
MQTLWGTAQSKTEIAPHAYWVSTAGHGGVMIAEATARKELTPEAYRRGDVYGNYLCYEEDCLWAIVAFEKPTWFMMNKVFLRSASAKEIQNDAWKTLSAWNADYLIERGIKPEAESYKYFTFRREEDQMRKARNPRLIVSASAIDDKNTRVWTADGKEYRVKGYNPFIKGQHNLLEHCEEVISA